jgi:YbbR domain-containing protein
MGKFFSSDLAIKIISVVAALVMWMYVMNEQNPQVTYVVRDVPVKLTNLDQNKFALLDDSQKFFVNVKVKGRRSLIADLKPQDIDAEVNLRGRMEGENLLPVSVSVPGNIELLDFSPKEIMVSLDGIIEEQMPVSVDVKGVPVEGFDWAQATAKPQAVVVKGPRSRVNAIKTVSAQVDISGKDATVVTTLPLRVLDSQGKEQKDISFRPDMVEVTVPIVPVSSVSITPNIKGAPLEGYIIKDVRVEPPMISVTAPREILNQLQTVSTEPLSIQGYAQTITKEVKLALPRGVKTFNQTLKTFGENSNTVRVTVEIEKLSSRSLNLGPVDISIKDLPLDLQAEMENKDIILTVNGPESIIDRVNNNMIKVYVDAAGLSEGEHTLKIHAEAPMPYIIQKIEPDVIKVTIRRI